MANKPDIRKLLTEHGEVSLLVKDGIFNLLKNNGRFFYQVNGCTVGISEEKLDGIISRIPQDIRVLENNLPHRVLQKQN
jgi:hypothetical protein